MTTAQREARTFLAQFHHRPFSISDLKKALQAQGFSLVEYSRTSNCKEVTTLLTALRLFDYAASQSAFTYQDTNLRIVFILENLSQQEQMVLLSHELGHILCHHLDHAPITGPGTGVLQEQEANEFSADLMRYNQRCKPRRIALGVGATLAALALVCALLFASSADTSGTVYLTPSGRCYHKADCMFVEGKDNITALSPQQAEAAGYEPCSWCIGRSDS